MPGFACHDNNFTRGVYECTFSRGKAGPVPGGVHVKIQMGMAHPVLLGLKFGQILFFLGGFRKLGLFF